MTDNTICKNVNKIKCFIFPQLLKWRDTIRYLSLSWLPPRGLSLTSAVLFTPKTWTSRNLFLGNILAVFRQKEQELKAHLSIKYERERRTIHLVIDSCYLFPCGRAAPVRSASWFTFSLLSVSCFLSLIRYH